MVNEKIYEIRNYGVEETFYLPSEKKSQKNKEKETRLKNRRKRKRLKRNKRN